MIEPIAVKSVIGLYDEEETTTKIRGEGNWSIFCWFGRHDFVNGWLSLVNSYVQDFACFCEHCGRIKCIHSAIRKEYEVKKHDFYSVIYKIDCCQKCGHRIYTGSYGREKTSPEALSLIQEVNKEIGGGQIFGGEFYTAVAYTLLHFGKDAAISFIKTTYESGRIARSAMTLSGY